MEDGEHFGWPTVRAYHAVWLQNIEQSRATWEDKITHLKLCRSLVWHRLACSAQLSSTPASTLQAPTRAPRCTANPGHRACMAFNEGLCGSNVGGLHVCSSCLQTACRLLNHSADQKNGPWGGGAPALDRPPPRDNPSLPDPPPAHEGTGCPPTQWISTYPCLQLP